MPIYHTLQFNIILYCEKRMDRANHMKLCYILNPLNITKHNVSRRLLETRIQHTLESLEMLIPFNQKNNDMNIIVDKDEYDMLESAFKSQNVRIGIWSIEEETYMLWVLYYYFSGQLILEPNETIRSYLQRRLNCAASRISKKFRQQSIYVGHKTNIRLEHRLKYERDNAKKHLMILYYKFLSSNNRIPELLSVWYSDTNRSASIDVI